MAVATRDLMPTCSHWVIFEVILRWDVGGNSEHSRPMRSIVFVALFAYAPSATAQHLVDDDRQQNSQPDVGGQTSEDTADAPEPLAPRSAPAGEQTDLPSPVLVRERSDHRVVVALAFSHWFSPRIGAPAGIRTPSLLLSVRPAVSFLELRVRYVLGTRPVTLPAGEEERIGFGSLELVLTHGISLPGQSIDFHVGVLGGFVHAGDVTGCFGGVLGMLWLLDLSGDVGLGPYFEARMVSYPLAGDGFDFPDNIQADAQLDLGLALAFN